MDALLDGLNDAQKSAVTSPASVLQVLAPPGSGKTKTLTARVAYLVHHERLKPWNIIVCTFTIKAAREMKERICGIVGDAVASKLILGTFHSVARRFLVRYGQEIGIEKNFGIADTSDSKAIIKRIITRNDYTLEPGLARSKISGLKAKGTSAEQFAASAKQAGQHEFACIYAEYEETLKASNLLDYDDLLLRCTDLLRKYPVCVSSIEAVLIDEYQDTNNVQYELMRLLSQEMKRITIVGDPDQSIYGFRSAEIQNLYRMRNDYPDSIVINLENNYRSSGCILASAMAVIEQDESRPSKPLQATHCVGEQPTLRHLVNTPFEAKWIVEELQRSKTLAAGLLTFNDYAILLRSAKLSLSIEKALAKEGIPYRMVGGRKFFDRAEIKLLLDYLRVIDYPDHNDALARVINRPSRKVGDTTVQGLLQESEAKKVSLWSLILGAAQGRSRPDTKISSQAQKGIDMFVNLILTSRRKLLPQDEEECFLLDVINYLLQKLSFEAYLKSTYKDTWQERWESVEELVVQATQMVSAITDGSEDVEDALPVVEGVEQRPDTAADTLSKFLANVALSTATEQPEGEEANHVTISTIHAAKGLEWPVVFIPALYDGSIPHSRAEDHDEERRLLYVGMTRAQALLYLSCPMKQSSQDNTSLSKFISSRSIQKFLSLRGPSIGCSVITDLAQILRRPCPTNMEVEEARSQLERIEDDKYLLTREDIDGEEPTWNEPKPSNGGPQPYKRRKTESSYVSTNITVSTTMHKASSFSTATTTLPSGNIGFTSAKILQETRAIEALTMAPNLAAGKKAYNEAKRQEENDTKAPRSKSVKPRAAGQGSITSFFARPGKVVVEEMPSIVPRAPSLPRSQSSLSGQGPLSDISNVRTQSTKPYQAPTFTSHRPRTAPMPSKPKKDDSELGVESTRYVLLSSSPAKPDNDNDTRSERNSRGENEGVESEPKSPTKPFNPTAGSSFTGFRAASTFHTTSVGQLQSSSGPPKRRLGMGRSMQGWSVKHQQPPRPRQ